MKHLALLAKPTSLLLAAALQCSCLGQTAWPPALTFDPAHQKPLEYHDSSVEATLIAKKDGYVLHVRAASQGVDVLLPVEMAQVDEIRRIAGNRIAVRGMVNGSGGEVVLVDVDSGVIVDRFLCYWPSISPDGQMIAFVKFYPTHFVDNPDDHFMLYSAGKSAAENRPSGVQAADRVNVGQAFYPREVGNREFDNIDIPEQSRHAMMSAGFFWDDSSRRIVFAESTQRQTHLILAQIANPASVEVRQYPISDKELCEEPKDEATSETECHGFLRQATFEKESREISLAFQVNGSSKKLLQVMASSFR